MQSAAGTPPPSRAGERGPTESRHNLHHAGPTNARHGVDRGQIAPSAAVIRLLERLGRVQDARRPTSDRLAARRA
jgi:stearoyl-CoA desaturase (delta-9 desaturase)